MNGHLAWVYSWTAATCETQLGTCISTSDPQRSWNNYGKMKTFAKIMAAFHQDFSLEHALEP